MSVSLENVISIVLSVVLVLFSSIIHECAHGWVAYKCGDPTAKEAGRLTLDPRAHIDSFGSIVLPILMAIIGGPVFAFMKPVPYNPRRLKNPRRDELLVALAGPASNLLQAVVGATLYNIVWDLGYRFVVAGILPVAVFYVLLRVFATYVYVNLVLAFFNLIPLPPLDGSKLILYLLKGKAREAYYKLQPYSMAILLVILYVLPEFFGFDPLGIYLNFTAGNLYSLLLGA